MLRPGYLRPLRAISAEARRSYIELSKLIHTERAGPVSLVQTRDIHASSVRRQLRESHPVSSHELLEKYKATLHFPPATHAITALTGGDAPLGEEVTIHGYLGERADLSKRLSFVPVLSKELDVSIQIISSAPASLDDSPSSHDQLKAIEAHSPVAIKGALKRRKPTKSDSTGIRKVTDFEIELKEVQCLNPFPKDIIVKSDTLFPAEARHLQIRTDNDLRTALVFRAQVAKLCRELLEKSGFTEVETPLLFKSTPEGAREFLVPTRRKGLAYALPQSPQQYKQILMASGIPRYYQIAKCFRDEDLRADRQPEFTQLDLEMSFATGEDVMNTIEGLARTLWSDLLGVDFGSQPFPRMSYEDAMKTYGSDKPDTRLESKIYQVGHLIPADLISKISSEVSPTVEVMKLHFNNGPSKTREFVDMFMGSPESKPFQENADGAPGIFIIDSRKPLQGLQPFGFEAAERIEGLLNLEDGDLVVLQARKSTPQHTGGSTALGDLRLALHRCATQNGYLPEPTGFKFLWVTDFPLFSPSNDTEPGQGGTAGLASTHHPFTAPRSAADVDLLYSDPLAAKADHYDLVVNGVELGGGSRRIHDAAVQELVLRDILRVGDKRIEEFRHLLKVLRAGCPPHAGIALGFDRLVAVMLGRESVRDVIAFPKSGRGEDGLVGSPGVIGEEGLETYHLRVRED